jgi:hypothetical protein
MSEWVREGWVTATDEAEDPLRAGRIVEFIDYVTSERERCRAYTLGLVSSHVFVANTGLYVIFEPAGPWKVTVLSLALLSGTLALPVVWIHRHAPRSLTGYATEVRAIFGMQVFSSLFRRYGIPVWMAYLLRVLTVGVFLASVAFS